MRIIEFNSPFQVCISQRSHRWRGSECREWEVCGEWWNHRSDTSPPDPGSSARDLWCWFRFFFVANTREGKKKMNPQKIPWPRLWRMDRRRSASIKKRKERKGKEQWREAEWMEGNKERTMEEWKEGRKGKKEWKNEKKNEWEKMKERTNECQKERMVERKGTMNE